MWFVTSAKNFKSLPKSAETKQEKLTPSTYGAHATPNTSYATDCDVEQTDH